MKNLSNSPKINNLFDKVQKNLELKENGSFSGILSSIQSLENDFLEDYTNRKKEGVYYTKKVISNFIFSETLCLLLKKRFNIKPIKNFNEILRLDEDLKNKIKLLLLNLKICDPACGSGVFLLSAVDLLYETIKKLDFRGQSSIIGVQLMDNLFGYDISDAAIKLTILKLLKWYSLNFNSNLNQIFNILCSNIRIEDSITSKINTKFDIVVGNPPYGNILTKNQKSFLKDENLFYNDIYCAYLLKAINWCDGIVGFLVPKSFLLRQSYIEFRNKLLSKSNLLKIFDIGPNLFKKATNEVQIILYEKKINEVKQLQIFEYPNKEIIILKNQNFDKLNICINSYCPFCDKTKKVFIYTFESKCPYCDSKTIPLNRIKIKANKKINKIISKIERSGDLNYLNIRNFPKMIRGEEEKGLKQIKKVINPNTEGSCLFLYAKDDFNYYYFNKNKSFNIEKIKPEILKGRNYEYYTNPKLLIKHNNIIPQALFTKDIVCFTSSIYSILNDNSVELKYLCALLNSILIQFYCIFGINNQKNTTINLNQYMIRHLPIKNSDKQLKTTISQKVDEIIENFEKTNGTINQKIITIIKELDRLIFQLYTISDDEQKFLISEVKKTIPFFTQIYSNLK